MARYASTASATFFSGARRPTQSATSSSPLTPHVRRSAGLRRAGEKSSVSTPRPRTWRFSKPEASREAARAALGTKVPAVRL
jgi:hypothetical protein